MWYYSMSAWSMYVKENSFPSKVHWSLPLNTVSNQSWLGSWSVVTSGEGQTPAGCLGSCWSLRGGRFFCTRPLFCDVHRNFFPTASSILSCVVWNLPWLELLPVAPGECVCGGALKQWRWIIQSFVKILYNLCANVKSLKVSGARLTLRDGVQSLPLVSWSQELRDNVTNRLELSREERSPLSASALEPASISGQTWTHSYLHLPSKFNFEHIVTFHKPLMISFRGMGFLSLRHPAARGRCHGLFHRHWGVVLVHGLFLIPGAHEGSVPTQMHQV